MTSFTLLHINIRRMNLDCFDLFGGAAEGGNSWNKMPFFSPVPPKSRISPAKTKGNDPLQAHRHKEDSDERKEVSGTVTNYTIRSPQYYVSILFFLANVSKQCWCRMPFSVYPNGNKRSVCCLLSTKHALHAWRRKTPDGVHQGLKVYPMATLLRSAAEAHSHEQSSFAFLYSLYHLPVAKIILRFSPDFFIFRNPT